MVCRAEGTQAQGNISVALLLQPFFANLSLQPQNLKFGNFCYKLNKHCFVQSDFWSGPKQKVIHRSPSCIRTCGMNIWSQIQFREAQNLLFFLSEIVEQLGCQSLSPK